jgi:ribose transport system ATP-binding protein
MDRIINMMVGRTIYEATPELPEAPSRDVLLEVRGLNRGRAVRDVNFKLYRGEILGFAGLVGAGRTEVARAIFGADRASANAILVHGKPAHIRTPSDAVRAGIAYLSEDRKRYGLALGMDVETNIVLATFRRFLRWLGWVDTSETQQTASRFVKTLDIRTPSLQQQVKNLSGGNQQKVIIARELSRPLRLLIASQPTRGLDVGSIEFIHRQILAERDEGRAVLLVSAELDEILALSDRIGVLDRGQLVALLPRREATRERLGLLMAGGGDGAAKE